MSEVIKHVANLRQKLAGWRKEGYTIAFVPTMGNLHAGHLSLVEKAKTVAAKVKVVVSIFVNPLQFGPNEDLDSYPRTFAADQEKLEQLEVDTIFAPTVAAIYGEDQAKHTKVVVPALDNILCGEFRPQFFSGVATVVAKLFNMVLPDVAIFGEKDFQQLLVIQQMVKDLCMQVQVIGMPIVREADGLAMSSRNNYLSAAERQQSLGLYHALTAVQQQLNEGATEYAKLQELGTQQLLAAGFNKVDYFRICRQRDLQPATVGDAELIVLGAAWLGKTRLIDNMKI